MSRPASVRALRQRARVRLRRVPLALALKAGVLEGLDRVDTALGRRAALEPPRRLRQVGAGDFRAVGTALLEQVVELGGLAPDARVLDLGCGAGRLAIPLTAYLTGGSYQGFDISPAAIGWCREAITARFPRFGFSTIDIANTHYNPSGGLDASGMRFPYGDRSFDCAVANSLFTHLLPGAARNYLGETGRVLAPGGTFFGTFFLLDDRSRERLERGASDIDLPHRLRDSALGVEYRAMDEGSPETALGLEEAFVRQALAEAAIEVTAVHRGSWAGGGRAGNYQDVVVGRRVEG